MHVVLIKAGGINLPLGLPAYDAQRVMCLAVGEGSDEFAADHFMRNMIRALGASVEKVVISGMSTDIFLADVFLKRGDEEFMLSAYPSDALILGLSFKVPMLIDEEVLIEATSNDNTQEFLSVLYENDPDVLET